MSNQQQLTENAISDLVEEIMCGRLFTKKLCRKDIEKYNNIETIDSKNDDLQELEERCIKSIEEIEEKLDSTDVETEKMELRNSISASKVLKGQIGYQIRFLGEATYQLIRGNFFSSLDDVWDIDMAELNNAEVNTFNRNHFATLHNGNDTRNEATAEGARCMNSEAIHSCSSKETSGNKVNIFGASQCTFDSAPLMPQSKQCAQYWFHLVPWVLHVPFDQDWSVDDQWVYMQKCIHGFSLEDGIEIDDSNRQSVSKKPKVEQHITEDDNDNLTIYSTSMNSRRRANSVGIKIFASNQILLYNPKYYFDKFNCILIVPILDKGAVKDWNGEGYDAIVLCSKFNEMDSPSAKEVYSRIDAHKRPLLFAAKTECDTACELLKDMILSLCKSFKETFPIDFLYSKHEENHSILEKVCNKLSIQIDKPDMDQDVRKEHSDLELEQVVVLENNPTVPVPKSKDWTEQIINVRKIKFCGSGNQIENQSLAPDPVLLLAKAASNWLQLQDIPLLPVYNDDSSLDNSNYTVTFSVEAGIRGWDTESNKKPSVDEINFVPNNALFDESLSDDEE